MARCSKPDGPPCAMFNYVCSFYCVRLEVLDYKVAPVSEEVIQCPQSLQNCRLIAVAYSRSESSSATNCEKDAWLLRSDIKALGDTTEL